MMETWGGKCVPSPSTETKAGQDALARDPNTPGSLGIAISEAIEQAVGDTSGKTRYSLGSVLNHVMLHQTIIGLETKKQLAMVDEYPDVVIGCAGGGSNFAGLAFPFVYDKIHGKDLAIYPVEPAACPTLTRAPFVYDHGDTARYTPLLPMHSLGHEFVPPPIHAGGLRYHGMAPTVSQLVDEGILEPSAVVQSKCYEAGLLWARTEGFIPAPETTHALALTIEEAPKGQRRGEGKGHRLQFQRPRPARSGRLRKVPGGAASGCALDRYPGDRCRKGRGEQPDAPAPQERLIMDPETPGKTLSEARRSGGLRLLPPGRRRGGRALCQGARLLVGTFRRDGGHDGPGGRRGGGKAPPGPAPAQGRHPWWISSPRPGNASAKPDGPGKSPMSALRESVVTAADFTVRLVPQDPQALTSAFFRNRPPEGQMAGPLFCRT